MNYKALFVMIILVTSSTAHGMMHRIRLEKELENLKEEDAKIQSTIGRLTLQKNAILATSFFFSIAIGLKLKRYSPTFIPPLLAFPAMLYTHHEIDKQKLRRKIITPSMEGIENGLRSLDGK